MSTNRQRISNARVPFVDLRGFVDTIRCAVCARGTRVIKDESGGMKDEASKKFLDNQSLGTSSHYRSSMVNEKAFIWALILALFLAGCTQATAAPMTESTIISVASTITPTAPATNIAVAPTVPSPNILHSNFRPIDLQVGNKQVSLTIVQNGKAIPVVVNNSRHATVSLAPDTFTIRVEGDKGATSILGQTDATLLDSLERYTRPPTAKRVNTC